MLAELSWAFKSSRSSMRGVIEMRFANNLPVVVLIIDGSWQIEEGRWMGSHSLYSILTQTLQMFLESLSWPIACSYRGCVQKSEMVVSCAARAAKLNKKVQLYSRSTVLSDFYGKATRAVARWCHQRPFGSSSTNVWSGSRHLWSWKENGSKGERGQSVWQFRTQDFL